MLYFIISLLPLVIFSIIKTKKAFHMLQQNWYNDGKRYWKWLISNYNKAFFGIDILFGLSFLLIMVNSNLAKILFALLYMVIAYLYYKNMKSEQSKKPLVITKRVHRLIYTMVLIYGLILVTMLLNYKEQYLWLYYLVLGMAVYINYLVVLIANFINKPLEKFVYYYYKQKAMNKLKNMSNLRVIGITGSYGKTSCKNILNDVLNIKYNSYATPKSFNTPYGLIITINNHLDKFNDFLVAEMGAFVRGEIKGMCDLVKPTYGILTKIGTAHLESFGSQENIQLGKFELIESLPVNGIGILNGDDELQLNYKLKNKCQIVWFGIDNHQVDVYAKDITLSHKGTTFKVVFKGDKKEYLFETKLLGKANVYNVLSAITLGYQLGMSVNQLQMGVRKVNVIEHRLELKKYGRINIIDDAYNSNPDGSKMAIEVLDMMPGKKIVVTPGMIELGTKQYESNMIFGKQIAKVADEVILVGKEQTKPIFDGLMVSDYDPKKVHIINDVKEAFTLMQKLQGKETYVLLENDLPDIFNEK